MFASISPSHLSQGDGQPDREHKEINVLPVPQGRLEGDKVFADNETFRSSQVISGHVFISSLVCIGPVYAMVHMLLRYYKQNVPPSRLCIIHCTCFSCNNSEVPPQLLGAVHILQNMEGGGSHLFQYYIGCPPNLLQYDKLIAISQFF